MLKIDSFDPNVRRDYDQILDFFGQKISIQLISSNIADPDNDNKGKLGKPAKVKNWAKQVKRATSTGDVIISVKFEWDDTMGVPGAFVIKNNHAREIYIKSMTLWNVPGSFHFECNSWVYPAHRYKYDRIFFANKAYLPNNTPEPLRYYREQELRNLRGNGSGKLKEWDRVYDYACYNDLGLPDEGPDHARPVLGGSAEYPYPRRGRTGREPTKSDPNTESRLPPLTLKSLKIYVPRDERFSDIKMKDFLANAVKSLGQLLLPQTQSVFEEIQFNEFITVQDIHKLYQGGVRFPAEVSLGRFIECIPFDMIRELLNSGGGRILKLPMPDVIGDYKNAWRLDEEFAREMLAGVNPAVIRLLKEFPAKSKLDPEVYGNQQSFMIRQEIEEKFEGLDIEKELKDNKLFILDYHDATMPYLSRIHEETSSRAYATRTLLLLEDDGILKPLAIELSVPFVTGSCSQVFFPTGRGKERSCWQLAKAYVAVNDSGYHQLISHWLNTHAVIEPFVIATNRQLSVLHPIYKLLHPHFKDTMCTNALARQMLINAGGVYEKTFFPVQYAMQMSSGAYKSWNFMEQALPADLVKRGMAVPDAEQPHGLRLLIEDYPYAVDGLDIWTAIETWVQEYCSFYYPTDETVQSDTELQAWWTEIRTVGHGDKKDEPWWPNMTTSADLVHVLTIIIWIASAQHAAVNFGQYQYAGYVCNRPTMGRKFIPQEDATEYDDLLWTSDGAFLRIFTTQFQTLLGASLMDVLSRHSPDEVYLGRRETWEWTLDSGPLEAFEKFGERMFEIERKITERNNDRSLRNRYGPIDVPYTLLYPGATVQENNGKGVPNSVSI